MTTDIKLLPLPEPMQVLGTRGKDAAEAWCRANVSHATAAKDAEIEALLAEVRHWKERGTVNLSELDSLREKADRAERLTEALQLARDLVEDWAGYAGEYSQKKHNLEGDLALLDAALRDHEQEGKDG